MTHLRKMTIEKLVRRYYSNSTQQIRREIKVKSIFFYRMAIANGRHYPGVRCEMLLSRMSKYSLLPICLLIVTVVAAPAAEDSIIFHNQKLRMKITKPSSWISQEQSDEFSAITPDDERLDASQYVSRALIDFRKTHSESSPYIRIHVKRKPKGYPLQQPMDIVMQVYNRAAKGALSIARDGVSKPKAVMLLNGVKATSISMMAGDQIQEITVVINSQFIYQIYASYDKTDRSIEMQIHEIVASLEIDE
jgi:hypothetical protein